MISFRRGTRPMTREMDRLIATAVLGYYMVNIGSAQRPFYELRDSADHAIGRFASEFYYNTSDEETAWSLYCPHFSGEDEPFDYADDGQRLVAELALRGWAIRCTCADGVYHATVTMPTGSTTTATASRQKMAIAQAVLDLVQEDRE